MFFGDYGLFKVPPFAEHREQFSISYATVLASEDNTYNPVTEAQLATITAFSS